MPFDDHSFASALPALDPGARNRRWVARWLLAICAMIVVMTGLGGATRLSGSGLSIMEWAPIMGTLPPLSEAEWRRLYALYQSVPQYDMVNKGFGLDGFKQIFWLEWAHRFWGRMIGLAFAIPFVWLAWRGAIERRLLPRLGVLFLLGGAQGAVGWFMVASGFSPDATTVSPYRLVIHLALALLLYAMLLWTALSLTHPQRGPGTPAALRQLALGVFALVVLSILAGGFVAGLRAGLTYNSFPLMDGRLVPAGYGDLSPFLRNLTENIATVQFNHRLLATLTGAATLITALYWLPRLPPGAVARALFGLTLAVLVQYALGVTTLLWVVPAALGAAHQVAAVLVLTAAVMLVHAVRKPR